MLGSTSQDRRKKPEKKQAPGEQTGNVGWLSVGCTPRNTHSRPNSPPALMMIALINNAAGNANAFNQRFYVAFFNTTLIGSYSFLAGVLVLKAVI